MLVDAFEHTTRPVGIRLLEVRTPDLSHADGTKSRHVHFAALPDFIPVEGLWLWYRDNPALIFADRSPRCRDVRTPLAGDAEQR